jgi:pSer/pThr/pTyr-binding forkhead associated (FHA) protein
MDYQLVVVRGRSASKTLRLADGITTVGRQEDCQLRIGSSQVSRKHCQLFEQGDRLVINDLKSSNGTFVNGKKIEGQQILKPGDVLTLGKVKFRVVKIDGTGMPKPGDTAVPEAPVSTGDSGSSDEFDIDFDDELEARAITPPETVPVADDTVKVEKTKPASKAMGEEAVADFLLNIDLDDEDK